MNTALDLIPKLERGARPKLKHRRREVPQLPAVIGNVDTFRVVAYVNPFAVAVERADGRVPVGYSISQVLEMLKVNPRQPINIQVNGEIILPTGWDDCRPPVNASVTIRVLPAGGHKNFGAIFAQLGVMALTAVAFAFGGVLAGILVSLLGNLLISALIPPSTPKRPRFQANPNDYTISGDNNLLAPFSVVPRNFGTNQPSPAYATSSFTEVHGRIRHLVALFTFGFGPQDITGTKLVTTLLDTYHDLEYDWRLGFPDDAPSRISPYSVFEQDISIVLLDTTGKNTAPVGWVTQTTQALCDRIQADLSWPNGLEVVNDVGNARWVQVAVQVEYALVGTSHGISGNDNWLFPPSKYTNGKFVYKGTSGAFVSTTISWDVPRGQYDVRIQVVQIILNGNTNQTFVGTTEWTALRSISFIPPIAIKNQCYLAVRIRASNQLNGQISNLNAIVTSILKKWDPTWNGGMGAWDQRAGAWDYDWDNAATAVPLYSLTPNAVDTTPAHNSTGKALAIKTVHGSDRVAVASKPVPVRGQFNKSIGQDQYAGDSFKLSIFYWANSALSAGVTVKVFFAKAQAFGSEIGNTDFAVGDADSANTVVVANNIAATISPQQLTATIVVPKGINLSKPGSIQFTKYMRVVVYHDADGVGGKTIYFDDVTAFFYVTGGPVPNLRGLWDGSTTYNINDVVRFNGVYYTSILGGVNHEPDTSPTYWSTAAYQVIANGSFDYPGVKTSNPAACFREVQEGPANQVAVGDDGIDLPALQNWSEYADANGYKCNMMLDREGTVPEVLRAIAAVGRASYLEADSVGTVVLDQTQTAPVGHFGSRNIRNLKGFRPWPIIPHALKVMWRNPLRNYQKDIIVAYDDGYSPRGPEPIANFLLFTGNGTQTIFLNLPLTPAYVGPGTFSLTIKIGGVTKTITDTGGSPTGIGTLTSSSGVLNGSGNTIDYYHGFVSLNFVTAPDNNQQGLAAYTGYFGSLPATLFETLDESEGITDGVQAWRAGRYHLAVGRLRSEQLTFETDAENINCKRGDLLYINHDLPVIGLTSARIISVAPDGSGGSLGVTLDEPLLLYVEGLGYQLRVRRSDGVSILLDLANPVTPNVSTVTSPLTQPWAAARIALRGVNGNQPFVHDQSPLLFNTGSSVSLAYPAVTEGDAVLAFISLIGVPTAAIAAPTGWSLVRQDSDPAGTVTQAIFYKTGVGTESGTATFTWGGSLAYQAIVQSFSGPDGVLAIDSHAGGGFASATVVTPPYPEIERPDECLELIVVTQNGNPILLTFSGTSTNLWANSGFACNTALPNFAEGAVCTFASDNVSSNPQPELDDLVFFGITGKESLACVVLKIAPGPNQSAVFTVTAYAPEIFVAETFGVPIVPVLNAPAVVPAPVLTTPNSNDFVIKKDVDGSHHIKLTIGLSSLALVDYPDVLTVEVQYRISDYAGANQLVGNLGPWSNLTDYVIGNIVSDAGAWWVATAASGPNPRDWQANHQYALGALIKPLTNNAGGYTYQATALAGTGVNFGKSGGSGPSPWNQTVSGTQADNNVTWTNIGVLLSAQEPFVGSSAWALVGAWNGGTAYVINDYVYSPTTFEEYIAVQSSTGVNPDTDDGTYWHPIGTDSPWISESFNPQDQITISEIGVKEEYDVRARFLLTSGSATEWGLIVNSLVTGKSSLPDQVTSLTAVALPLGGAKLTWAAPARPDVRHYEVRRGSSWALGTFVTQSKVLHVIVDQDIGPGSQTYWVATIDTAGNYSDPSLVPSVTVTMLGQANTLGTSAAPTSFGATSGWTANHQYVLGDIIVPATNNAGGYAFQAVTLSGTGGNYGKSGASSPNPWNQTPGANQSDNNVVWENIGVLNAYSTWVTIVSGTLTVSKAANPVQIKAEGDSAFENFNPNDEMDIRIQITPSGGGASVLKTGRMVVGRGISNSAGELSGVMVNWHGANHFTANVPTLIEIQVQLVNGSASGATAAAIDVITLYGKEEKI